MGASVLDGSLSTPEMIAVFGADSLVQAMMDFEAALAHAQAAEGLIRREAALAIAGVCKAELYDTAALVAASGQAGGLAVPLVRKLAETVGLFDAEAAAQVHWGGTAQDVTDTGMVLATRRALALLDRDLTALIAALLALVDEHGHAPVLARTFVQPVTVVSFGFKLAAWLQPLVRAQACLHEAGERALQLQLGGADGTLSALGDKAQAVARRVADALQLPEPHGAWHTQRDDWVRLGAEVGVLCGSLGKVARDWALMCQTEIGELVEPPPAPWRGSGCGWPPVRESLAAMIALAAAQRAPLRVAGLLQAMAQEHERGLGNWQAELAEWSGLFLSAHGSVKALAEAAAGLQVDTRRMRENIEGMHGLVAADGVAARIARVIGKTAAQALIEPLWRRAGTERRHLRGLLMQALADNDSLRSSVPPEEVDGLFDPDASARTAVERAEEVLARLRPRAHGLAARRPWAQMLPLDG
jgi:3-carboxy-cis,cis-muconate cycloisomerase